MYYRRVISNRVVTQLECLSLDSSEPTLETGKVQRNLLACINQENRPWRLELRSRMVKKLIRVRQGAERRGVKALRQKG
jgi:hypothetical protein